MNWDNVELIRNAQNSARKRLNEETLINTERIREAVERAAASGVALPALTEVEAMIFKMRAELIDYIVAHGLVDGLIWDGVLQQTQGGKIVITKEMVETITRKLGYFTESDVQAFLERYLPENDYVQDGEYVHTDNNYTTEDKDKLAGIEAGAEVNKVIDVIFNAVTVLDPETRVATITITPQDIKEWYEQNPDTNAFTDAQKEKLAGITAGAEVNRVDDVLVDNRSVLDDNKKAKITKEIIKSAYEANPDTNSLTDKEKAELAALNGWKNGDPTFKEVTASVGELGNEVNSIAGTVQHHGEDIEALKNATTPEAIKQAYESNPDTNAFTDAEKQKLANLENGAEVNLVNDVKLDGATIVKDKVAEITAAAIKQSYENNADTNAFTDADKQKLATVEANKINDVKLDGVTIVKDKVAEITAAAIKQSYESNADTNAFTNAEKTKLASLGEPLPIFSESGALNNKYINVANFLRSGDTQFLLQTITNGTDFLFVSFGLANNLMDIDATESPFGKRILIPILEEDLKLPPGKEPIAPGYSFMQFPVGFIARGQQGAATNLEIDNFTACAMVGIQFFWTANKKGFELTFGDKRRIDNYSPTAFSMHTGKAQMLLPLKNK